jgi:hypothetical protein
MGERGAALLLLQATADKVTCGMEIEQDLAPARPPNYRAFIRLDNPTELSGDGMPWGQALSSDDTIVSPAPSQTLAVGEAVEVWGWAWADGGVTAVELSIGGASERMRATLEPPTGRAWQRFSATWHAEHRRDYELSSWQRTNKLNRRREHAMQSIAFRSR